MIIYDTNITIDDSGFISATDLLKAGNKYRASKGASRYTFQNLTKTKEAGELIKAYGTDRGKACILTSRGRSGFTLIHPALAFLLAHNLGEEILKQFKARASEEMTKQAAGWAIFLSRKRVDSDLL